MLEDDRNFYAFDDLEKLRSALLRNDTSISVTDYGAGSRKLGNRDRKVSDIAKTSLTGKRLSELLFKLSKWKKPKTILELGTSLGLSSAYLTLGFPSAKTITLEGCPNIAAIAKQQHKQLKINQIDIHVGPFDSTLSNALNQLEKIDLVFIDGHHEEKATLAYWEQIKPFLNEEAIVIFDDIHWSKGMEAAWQEVLSDSEIKLSMDLFFKGIIVWKAKVREPIHKILIPRKWKPWRMGFWA